MNDIVPSTANRQMIEQLHSDSFERDALQEWHRNINTDPADILKKAMIVLFLIFGVGGVWSTTAKIGGAVVASGRVIAENRNRVIQHLEGGILDQIYVQEGQHVEEGDLLVKLDDTQVNAQLNSSRVQRAILRVELARRRAEVNEAEEVSFPTDIHPAVAADERVIEAIESQRSEFVALKKYYEAKVEILESRIRGEEGDIVGNNEVLKAYDRQQELYVKELEDYRDLHEKGLMQRTRVFATERRVAELEARIKNVALANEKSRNNIESLQNEIKQTRLGYLKEANEGVVGLQKALNELQGVITRLEDVASRSIVRSPSSGVVFRINKRTLGAVLAPGEPIMEIFPRNDSLTLEAQIQTRDIENVYVGQDVEVVFPSGRDQELAPIPGKVTYLSADSLITDSNPMGSYVARITLSPEEGDPRELLAGNLAEVYVKTEPKTFLQHITGPITKFAFKMFKG